MTSQAPSLFILIFLHHGDSCPPVAVVLARMRMAGERVETFDQLEFDVVEVADTMGWQLPLVKRGLRQLQWSTDRGVCLYSNVFAMKSEFNNTEGTDHELSFQLVDAVASTLNSPHCPSTSVPTVTSAMRKWTECASSSINECWTKRRHSSTSSLPALRPSGGTRAHTHTHHK